MTARIASNKRVRRSLPGRGRLHVDRQLPFLCLYRTPLGRDDPGSRDLVRGEASYLIAPAAKKHRRQIAMLIDRIAATLAPEFGGFLIVELWSGPDEVPGVDPRSPDEPPLFRILASPNSAVSKPVETLASELKKIKVLKQVVHVAIERTSRVSPPQMGAPLAEDRARQLRCHLIGIEVPPVWRDPQTERDFPLVLRTLRRRLSHALKRGIYDFVAEQTTHRPPHYHALGRRAVVKAVWDVDRQLASVSNAFDFLLQVTPINTDSAWKQFKASRFERQPDFHYLPTPMDPAVLKQELYRIPVARVEDAALHHLFQQKQIELDRKITMLRDRNTPDFLYGSLQLFGRVSDSLNRLAEQILEVVPSRTKDDSKGGKLSASEFAARAELEFAAYREQWPDFRARAEVSGRAAGIMVSQGKLLINKHLQFPHSRVEALLHHEIGTHLLTYYNGRAQPFRQLSTGLAGYDELQEGLAVMAEYLVGGLNRPRIRQLAARVVAARLLVDGASFIESFRTLDRRYDFSQRAAYNITMRIYRGGGLTKDAVYLRGLRAMLRYLADDGQLEPLFVGKLAAEHVSIINELRFRKVLAPPPLRPRYLDLPEAGQRLKRLRQGLTVIDLLQPT